MLSKNQIPDHVPDAPTELSDIGLPEGFLQDLALKAIYTKGTMEGSEISDFLKLPFGSVLSSVLDDLEDEKYLEVKGGGQFADQWDYQITQEGRKRVREIFEESRYIGPAPVPLDQYDEVTSGFAIQDEKISRGDLERAFSDLLVSDEYFDVFGPAMNSGRSVFVFGKPGNGKTVMCERAIDAFGDYVAIPHAIFAGGSVIKVHDEHYHDEEEVPNGEIDERWLVSERPFVSVGGELTMKELDLIYNPEVGFYEAPFQLKANTGVLLIDDFGRQQMPPGELLNRWIVPLEKRRDYLTLHTGLKINVPFEVLVFYSTNLDPEELVDEAFLRRLRYKIHTDDPDESEYRELFQRECDRLDIPFDESTYNYLMERHYEDVRRPLRRCHPRDLLETVQDYCKYRDENPQLSENTIDEAAETYFPDNVIQTPDS